MAPPAEKKQKLLSAIENQQQSSSSASFVTPFGGRKKIWICNDVWMDILPFFRRPQLCLKFAPISPRFDVLVDTHFDCQPALTIWKTFKIYKKNCDREFYYYGQSFVDEEVPHFYVLIGGRCRYMRFPLHELPNKIRFNFLQIEYIDPTVIEFLRSNKQIFDRRGTKMTLQASTGTAIWDVLVGEIWPIFASSIRHLAFYSPANLNDLRGFVSPTILTDLLQLKSISSYRLFPAPIAFDGPNSTAGEALSKWLNTPTTDGQPKHLRCRFSSNYASRGQELVNKFKEAFLHATTTSSACYNIEILLDSASSMDQFEVVNEATQEKLTLQKEGNCGKSKCFECEKMNGWLLKKRSLSSNVVVFGETVQHQLQRKHNILNNLHNVRIELSGQNCIGPLSPPANQNNEKGANL